MNFIESDEERERRFFMETTETQSKANTWMRKREQEFIARGWKVSYGTGSGAIISPKLCEKLKKVSETEIVFGCTCTKRKIRKEAEKQK